MKSNTWLTRICLLLLSCGLFQSAFAQPTAFTYQGRLITNGSPANGLYDFVFRLCDTNIGGNYLGFARVFGLAVTNGLFTATMDFGGAFSGADRWLEISVGEHSNGFFYDLSPRQQITATPYAIMAGSASNALTADSVSLVPATNITGAILDSNLSTNVALRSGGNGFTGEQTITSGSLGIGSRPTESLLINGGNAFIVGANAGNPGASGSLFFGSDSTTRDGALLRTSAGDLAFWTYNGGWSETMRLLNGSGYVGIGKTNPLATLDVNGIVLATGFGGDGASLTSLDAGHLSLGTLADARLSPNVALRFGGNAFVGNQTIANGILGVGTANPAVSLEVSGFNSGLNLGGVRTVAHFGSASSTASEGAAITIGNQDSSNSYAKMAVINENSSPGSLNPALTFSTMHGTFAPGSELERVRITSDGLVGIGKTNPATALDVNGTVTASNFVGNGSGLASISAANLSGTLANSQLANNSITLTAGTGLGGGGVVALGGSTTLSNSGVLSVTGNPDIMASPSSGAVILGSTATNSNTPGRIVKRDANGNFSAGTVTLAGTLDLPASGIIDAGGLPFIHAHGSENVFAGLNAGNLTMTSGENVAVGVSALNHLTTAGNNVAVGYHALFSETSGGGNTAIGSFALEQATSGLINTALGYFALDANTTGGANTAVGARALFSNTDGGWNSAFGDESLYSFTSGYGNTAIGVTALHSITNGFNNIGLGFGGGSSLTDGSNNICIGNSGAPGDQNTIRIGTPGIQTATVIAGVISGNGAGLTNVSGPSAGNYVFCYTTTNIASGSGAVDVPMNTDAVINGWTHTIGSSTYTCAQTGLYLVQYTGQIQANQSGTTGMLQAVLNSSVVSGSQAGASIVGSGTPNLGVAISKSFVSNINSGDTLKLQFNGSSANVFLLASFGNSVSMTITRIQ